MHINVVNLMRVPYMFFLLKKKNQHEHKHSVLTLRRAVSHTTTQKQNKQDEFKRTISVWSSNLSFKIKISNVKRFCGTIPQQIVMVIQISHHKGWTKVLRKGHRRLPVGCIIWITLARDARMAHVASNFDVFNLDVRRSIPNLDSKRALSDLKPINVRRARVTANLDVFAPTDDNSMLLIVHRETSNTGTALRDHDRVVCGSCQVDKHETLRVSYGRVKTDSVPGTNGCGVHRDGVLRRIRHKDFAKRRVAVWKLDSVND
jgi:hypothetical protein